MIHPSSSIVLSYPSVVLPYISIYFHLSRCVNPLTHSPPPSSIPPVTHITRFSAPFLERYVELLQAAHVSSGPVQSNQDSQRHPLAEPQTQVVICHSHLTGRGQSRLGCLTGRGQSRRLLRIGRCHDDDDYNDDNNNVRIIIYT